MPGAIRPRRPSSPLNQATFSVHIRSASVRSRRLRSGVRVSPPTVRPETSQLSETQGL